VSHPELLRPHNRVLRYEFKGAYEPLGCCRLVLFTWMLTGFSPSGRPGSSGSHPALGGCRTFAHAASRGIRLGLLRGGLLYVRV